MNEFPETTSDLEELAPQPSLGDRFTDLVTAPARAMTGIAVRPAWGIPAVIIAVLVFAFTMATIHITEPEQQLAMADYMAEHMPDEALDEFDAQIDEAMNPSMVMRVLKGLMGSLGAVFLAIMIPALLNHLFARLSEGQGKVGQTLGVVYWSALMVFGLKTILSWIVIVVTGTARWAPLSLQIVVGDQNPLNPLVVLAQYWGDPFFYWTLWLMVIGMATVHRLPLAKSAVVVGAVHLLLSGLAVAMVFVGRLFIGMAANQ